MPTREQQCSRAAPKQEHPQQLFVHRVLVAECAHIGARNAVPMAVIAVSRPISIPLSPRSRQYNDTNGVNDPIAANHHQ
nr:hypothetical protein [Thermobaculum terrenum]